MDPVKFLDNKTKEKALMEEMKKKYDTKRGCEESSSNRSVMP
jgi:hypothetical protein